MESVTLAISGMSCGHCVAAVREALAAVPGIGVEQVTVGAARVRLAPGASAETLGAAVGAVREAGYEATVDAAALASPAGTGSVCCAPLAPESTPRPPAMTYAITRGRTA